MPRSHRHWCEAHHRQQLRGEQLRTARINTPDRCHVRGCWEASDGSVPGWCRFHEAQADQQIHVHLRRWITEMKARYAA